MTSRPTADGYQISIASKKLWSALLFGPVMVVLWALGAVLVVGLQSKPGVRPPDLFSDLIMAFWWIFWAAWGLGVAYVWLWVAFGKELVTVRYGNLVLKKDILGFGRSKAFPVSSVSNLRASGPFGSRVVRCQIDVYAFRGGVITFESGGKTHRFGIQLEEGEAREVVAQLAERLPMPKPELR